MKTNFHSLINKAAVRFPAGTRPCRRCKDAPVQRGFHLCNTRRKLPPTKSAAVA